MKIERSTVPGGMDGIRQFFFFSIPKSSTEQRCATREIRNAYRVVTAQECTANAHFPKGPLQSTSGFFAGEFYSDEQNVYK